MYPSLQYLIEYFIIPEILWALPMHPSPPPILDKHGSFFTVSTVLLFRECYIFVVMQYVAFSDRLVSLSNRLLFLYVLFVAS